MNDLIKPTSIATPQQYRAALLAVRARMTEVQLKMLQAHCQSEDHSASMNRLAETAGLPAGSGAGIRYSNLAHWIADELKFTPGADKKKQRWLDALAYVRPDGMVDDQDEWVMRPELVETLQAMKWA